MKGKRMTDLKAFTVNEPMEYTGGIVFAKSNIVARRLGANEYNDGELGGMTVKRAPWADSFVGKLVPASIMIAHGWHFECSGCGRRIDSDLADLWENEVQPEDSGRDMVKARRRYCNWHPADVIGTQSSAVFCDQQCKDAHDAYRAECKAKETWAIEAFKAKILRRFPDAELINDPDRLRPHAYATTHAGRIVVRQVVVEFAFPGMQYGPASLRWESRASSRYRKAEKPYYSCCSGDREAFEAYAAATKGQPQEKAA